MSVIAVAQPAARPWDGSRRLRFLTGLALLALAVTLRLPAPAVEAAPAAPVTSPISTSAVSSAPSEPMATEAEPDPAPLVIATPAPVSFTTRIPSGEIPGTSGSRAPPAV